MSGVDPEQAAALDALLPLVPLYGWTNRAVVEMLKEAGGMSRKPSGGFPAARPK